MKTKLIIKFTAMKKLLTLFWKWKTRRSTQCIYSGPDKNIKGEKIMRTVYPDEQFGDVNDFFKYIHFESERPSRRGL
jgi:hypothetical protein